MYIWHCFTPIFIRLFTFFLLHFCILHSKLNVYGACSSQPGENENFALSLIATIIIIYVAETMAAVVDVRFSD